MRGLERRDCGECEEHGSGHGDAGYPPAAAARRIADAVERGGADAVLAAGIFHFGQCTIRDVKLLFQQRGIPVRPPC